MKCFREMLYLSFMKGIGRSVLNREFVPWVIRQSENTGVRRSGEEAYDLAQKWLYDSGRMPARWERDWMKRRTQEVLRWLNRQPDTVVLTVLDPEYPPQLMNMEMQRPPILYVRGERSMLPMLSSLSIAVIGSRWPGEYAIQYAPIFVDKLAEGAGMPIVSGLARGCDRMGHEAAIRAGVPTIAVMPCGPDRIVPEVNRDLATRILDGHGLLITEYPPGTLPEDYRYVERDRITAALSSATVVIQGARDSGTMQTVRASRAYRRPVACWLPEGLKAEESDEFEGNRYMADTYGAYALQDEVSVRNFADRLRRKGFQAPERTEQLSFI